MRAPLSRLLTTVLHYCIAQANFLINGMHELGHGFVFKTKHWNGFFMRIISFLVSGAPQLDVVTLAADLHCWLCVPVSGWGGCVHASTRAAVSGSAGV